MAKKIIVKLVEKSNKSRKGLYVYVREPGQKESLYKFNPEVPLDAYVDIYNSRDQYKNKKYMPKTLLAAWNIGKYKKGSPLEHIARKGQRFKRKYGGKRIFELIKMPITKVVINDTLSLSEHEINMYHDQLLSRLVLNKTLRNVLSLEENVQYLKPRLQFKFKILNEKSETLAEFAHVRKHTIRSAISEVKDKFGFSKSVDETTYQWLKERDYSYSITKKGNIARIQMEVSMVK